MTAYNDPRKTLGHFVKTNAETIARIARWVPVTSNDVVLDIGCGDGTLLLGLAKIAGCRAIGVEIDADLFERALRSAEEEEGLGEQRLKYYCTSAEEVTVEEMMRQGVTLVYIYALYVAQNPTIIYLLRQFLIRGVRVVTSTFELPAEQLGTFSDVWPDPDTDEGLLELMGPSCTTKLHVYGGDESVFLQDRQYALKAVLAKGSRLKEVCSRFRNDKEIVLAAVKTDGMLLRFASVDLRDDEEVVRHAKNVSPRAIKWASARLRESRDFLPQTPNRAAGSVSTNLPFQHPVREPLARPEPPRQQPRQEPTQQRQPQLQAPPRQQPRQEPTQQRQAWLQAPPRQQPRQEQRKPSVQVQPQAPQCPQEQRKPSLQVQPQAPQRPQEQRKPSVQVQPQAPQRPQEKRQTPVQARQPPASNQQEELPLPYKKGEETWVCMSCECGTGLSHSLTQCGWCGALRGEGFVAQAWKGFEFRVDVCYLPVSGVLRSDVVHTPEGWQIPTSRGDTQLLRRKTGGGERVERNTEAPDTPPKGEGADEWKLVEPFSLWHKLKDDTLVLFNRSTGESEMIFHRTTLA